MEAVDKDGLNCNLCCHHFSIECAYFLLGSIELLYEISILNEIDRKIFNHIKIEFKMNMSM